MHESLYVLALEDKADSTAVPGIGTIRGVFRMTEAGGLPVIPHLSRLAVRHRESWTTKNPHRAGFLWAFGWFWHHLNRDGTEPKAVGTVFTALHVFKFFRYPQICPQIEKYLEGCSLVTRFFGHTRRP
jgi:hypothetical protein